MASLNKKSLRFTTKINEKSWISPAFIWTCEIGRYLHIFPFLWENNGEKAVYIGSHVEHKRELLFYKLGTLFHTMFIILFPTIAIIYVSFLNSKFSDLVIGGFFIVIYLISLVAFVSIYFNAQNFAWLLNALSGNCQKVEKLSNGYLLREAKRYLDHNFTIFALIALSTVTLSHTPAALVIYTKIPPFGYFYFEPFWITIIFLFILIAQFACDWVPVLLISFGVMVHTVLITVQIKICGQEWKIAQKQRKRNRLHLLQRQRYILHENAMHAYRYILPCVIPLGEYLVVLTIFIIVKFYSKMNFLLAAIFSFVGLLALFIFKICLDKAAYLTVSSAEYKRIGKMKNQYNLSEYDIKFFKSCRPLHCRVGGTFNVERETFPRIFHEVIISTVVDLLVLFKDL